MALTVFYVLYIRSTSVVPRMSRTLGKSVNQVQACSHRSTIWQSPANQIGEGWQECDGLPRVSPCMPRRALSPTALLLINVFLSAQQMQVLHRFWRAADGERLCCLVPHTVSTLSRTSHYIHRHAPIISSPHRPKWCFLFLTFAFFPSLHQMQFLCQHTGASSTNNGSAFALTSCTLYHIPFDMLMKIIHECPVRAPDLDTRAPDLDTRVPDLDTLPDLDARITARPSRSQAAPSTTSPSTHS